MADQDELNENLRHLIFNIDSFDDAIIGKDLNGTIFSWNNGAELSYGYSPAEAVGKSISIIIPPERHGEFVDILARIKRGERIKHYETVRVRKDGTRIDVSITVSPITNKNGEIIGASSIARDITERKQIDGALRKTEERYHEERYRDLFEGMLEGVAYCRMVYDEKGHPVDWAYLAVNGSFEKLTGLRNVTGKRVTEAIPGIEKLDPTLFEVLGRVASKGLPEIFETEVKSLGQWLRISAFCPEKDHFVAIFEDITERKRTNDARRESEKRYRMLVESAAEAILVVQDEVIQLANTMATTMTGFSEQELLSKPFRFLIHPDDRAMLNERHKRRLKGEALPTRYEFRVLAKDGSTKWVQISAVMIGWEGRPATLNLLTDITMRREAEELLRESEKKYQLLVNSAAETILVIQDELIRMANPMAVTMTGFSKQELLSKPFPALIHPDDRAMAKEHHQKRLEGEAVIRYEFRMIDKDGSTKWIEISGVLIEWEGRPATLNLLTDITERKHAEMELKTKTADALESSQRARSYFDFLAHDIANLLSPILAYAELISLDTEASESSKKKAGKIVDQARRASSFILSLRRLEDAELIRQERMESRDLGTILDEAVTRVEAEYENKRISATVVHASEQVMFKGGKHLESIILGILDNSIGAAERDDIALEVKSTIVEENGHKFLKLELADDGPGISDDLKGSFMVSRDLRKQFETGISRGVASTLLISSAIVKSLGGALWVEDRIPGDCSKGSRIVIKFPQEGFFGT